MLAQLSTIEKIKKKPKVRGYPKKSFFFHFLTYFSYYDFNILAQCSTNLAQFSTIVKIS